MLSISWGYFESQSAITRQQSIYFTARRLSCIVFVDAIGPATMLLRVRIIFRSRRQCVYYRRSLYGNSMIFFSDGLCLSDTLYKENFSNIFFITYFTFYFKKC